MLYISKTIKKIIHSGKTGIHVDFMIVIYPIHYDTSWLTHLIHNPEFLIFYITKYFKVKIFIKLSLFSSNQHPYLAEHCLSHDRSMQNHYSHYFKIICLPHSRFSCLFSKTCTIIKHVLFTFQFWMIKDFRFTYSLMEASSQIVWWTALNHFW